MVVYLCQRYSPSSSHPPLPSVSTCLFPVSASVFLPCWSVHQYHFSRFHIHALIYDICFSDFTTSQFSSFQAHSRIVHSPVSGISVWPCDMLWWSKYEHLTVVHLCSPLPCHVDYESTCWHGLSPWVIRMSWAPLPACTGCAANAIHKPVYY